MGDGPDPSAYRDDTAGQAATQLAVYQSTESEATHYRGWKTWAGKVIPAILLFSGRNAHG